MLKKAIVLYGMPALRGRFADSRRLLPRHVLEGTVAALDFIEIKAKRILDVEIYQRPRLPFDPYPNKNDPQSLYNSFQKDFSNLVGMAVRGSLRNIAPHAIWIEFGTDDGGTGEHEITAVNGKMLHWIDPATGEDRFAYHVVVAGIQPTHFMERAFYENWPEVLEILRQHVRRALDPLIGEEN